MDWDDVKLALAVARCGSLNQAAVLLGINQSTVSRRLTALEADLATTLFKRSQKGLVPTDAGTAFIARAADIETRTEDLIETMRRTDTRPAGIVRLVSNQWVVDHLLRSGLAGFLSANPDIVLHTMAGRPQTSLWRGEPGVGLWFEAPPIDGAFAVKLGAVPYAVYRARDTDPTGWVAFHDEESPGVSAGLQAVRRLDPGTPIRLTALDAATLKEGIRAGIGKGLLPLCLGDADPDLEPVSDGMPELERMLHFHVHPDTLGSPRVEALLSWLRSNFAMLFRSDTLRISE